MAKSDKIKLCKAVKKGMPKKHPDEFTELIREARFFCEKCGRVSNNSKNLCKAHRI